MAPLNCFFGYHFYLHICGKYIAVLVVFIFFVNSNHLMSFAEVWSIARTHRSFFFSPDLGKTGLVIMAENLTCSR